MQPKIIAVDFDGTIVAHAYPEIGRPAPKALKVLKLLQAQGHKLILWTMRSGPQLQAAVDYCAMNDLFFWGVNSNPEQHTWTGSPKQYAHLYIDDAALGCPVLFDDGTQRHIVNWTDVEGHLRRANFIP